MKLHISLSNYEVCTTKKPIFDSKVFELPRLQEINTRYWSLRDAAVISNASKWIVLMEDEYTYEDIEFVDASLSLFDYVDYISGLQYGIDDCDSDSNFDDFVEFMIRWRCKYTTVVACMLALGKELRYWDYFSDKDYLHLKRWTCKLDQLGYKFPSIHPDEKESHRPRYLNCRQAYVNLTFAPVGNATVQDIELAQQKVRYLDDLKEWCGSALPPNQPLEPVSATKLAVLHSKDVALSEKRDTVLVIINNYPWQRSLGLLQRIHEPYFGLTIYCGTFDTKGLEEEGYPPTKEAFSFVNVHPEEMVRGVYLYFCLTKVAEMRLRNVKGYFVSADDLVFNFWHEINLDLAYHQIGFRKLKDIGWYNGTVGTPALERAIKLLTENYREFETVQNLRDEYEEKVRRHQNTTNALDFLISTDAYAASDFFYVPSTEIHFFADLMQIMFEAGVFKAIAVIKFLGAVKHIA
ncbi:unnamed protein product [Cylicocyclus nassatus]|uniref:Uncharacterized protein n=1 Tax=Cylicocyclus nassatus TaxID=53992 RepID=A0AA36GUD7_CYLNA|nr:unnamed protein product [Cylicocyclus nassatus]